jgi:hypothetical protein
MADERQIIIDVEVQDQDFDKAIGDINTQLKENQEQIKELNKDYKANATEIAKLEAKNRELSTSKRDLIKQSETEGNSLNALRLKLANLTKERNNLNLSNKESAARFEELQKAILETSTEIKGFEEAGGDFRRNVGNYTASIKEAVGNTEVFGISFNGLKEKALSFVNPITAVTAGVGALVGLYLSSAAGARDLASAQDKLQASITRISNGLASLVGADGKGGGLLSAFADAVNFIVGGFSGVIEGNLISSANRALEELEVASIEAQRFQKQQLDLAEQRRQIRDNDTLSFRERYAAANEVLTFINAREEGLLEVAEKRLAKERVLLLLDKDNLELQKRVKTAEFEVADIREDSQGQRTEALNGILALQKEEAEIEKSLQETIKESQQVINEYAITVETLNQVNVTYLQTLDERKKKEQELAEIEKMILADGAKEQEKYFAQGAKLSEEQSLRTQKAISDEKTLADIKRNLAYQGLADAQGIFQSYTIAGKALALTQIGFDTAQAISSLVRNSEANPANAVTFGGAGVLQFLAGAARIAANIAQAKRLLSNPESDASVTAAAPVRQSAPNNVNQNTQGTRGLANVNASLLSQFGDEPRNQAATNDAIAGAVGRMAPIYVAVTDINKAQNNRAVKVTETRLGG